MFRFYILNNTFLILNNAVGLATTFVLKAGISMKANTPEFFYLPIPELLGILKVISWGRHIFKTTWDSERTMRSRYAWRCLWRAARGKLYLRLPAPGVLMSGRSKRKGWRKIWGLHARKWREIGLVMENTGSGTAISQCNPTKGATYSLTKRPSRNLLGHQPQFLPTESSLSSR